MIKYLVTRSLFIFTMFGGILTSNAQLRLPQPSPTVKVIQNFGVSEITLDYSRPSLKGRTFGEGELNFYGKFWRTGANQGTTITFGSDVTVNGQKLPAGKYGFYSFPDKSEWTLIFSKNASVTDQAAYKQEDDVLRLKVQAEEYPKTETFTIDLNDFTPNSIILNLKWDKFKVPLKIESDSKLQTFSAIDKEVSRVGGSLAQAANYALDNGEIEKGKKWIEQSVNIQETFFNTLVKSKYLAKEGNYSEAVKFAEKSLSLAKEAKIDFYINQNEKNIEEWSSKSTNSKVKKK